jgi:uncharacterized heparinase superfamily protein
MRREKITDRVRTAAHVGGHRWRRLVVQIVDNPRFRWQIGLKVPERLLIAPQDLRTGDPTVANEVYAGEFAFAGKVVATEGRSPFEIAPPSREWNELLLGFGWLRHLRAAGTPIARENARSLVGDWIAIQGRGHPVAWEPEILTRRIISWLTQAPLILQDADHAFYRAFLRSLSRQVRYLRRTAFNSRDGYPRLSAAIALALAGLCIAGEARLLKRATKRLAYELERQILLDGGHISRNPSVLVALLLDLLPLRQAYAARNLPPPRELLNAIDRMMPMLRFFRHGDGAFAQFNGAGTTPADSIATVLAYDDARGTPVANAAYSGYQRIEAGASLIVADTGRPPPFGVSQDAHAGCLSFEFSHTRNRLIVNCGMPAMNKKAWQRVARATAAHSTATLNDTSSCRFMRETSSSRYTGTPIVAGPKDVRTSRAERDGAHFVRASHDGYAKNYGLVHQRSWLLSKDGARLDGEDVFLPASARRKSRRAPNEFALRFHLHPNVKASRLADGSTVMLVLPRQQGWLFSAAGREVQLEESVFLPSSDSPRRTSQIVIYGEARESERIQWRLVRAETAQAERRVASSIPELPL